MIYLLNISKSLILSNGIYVKGLSEKEYVETLCDYDIMVIDDLGATRMSEWEISVLDNIVAKRYNSKKHTIFNSNLAFLNGKNFITPFR